MAAATRRVASAAVGSLMVVSAASAWAAPASGRQPQPMPPVSRLASFAPGALAGVVLDERGAPVPGVVVSVLGATTTVAVTDKSGKFDFGTLAPGPYLVRAHLPGYVAPRAHLVQVNSSARSASSITIRREGAPQVLAAGLGGAVESVMPPVTEPDTASTPAPSDDHSETAWRIRHARAGVLKDATVPVEFLEPGLNDSIDRRAVDLFARAMESPARAATNFFVDTPFSGQVNLLTTGSFDSPQELVSGDSLSRNVALVTVGAPVGETADWTVSGALTQADISSWIVAGAYVTRAPARHRYDVGMSYSTQRYGTDSVLTLPELSERSRSAGSVYGYDSMSVGSAATLTYGAAYARYDYLPGPGLVSPRVELTLTPARATRVSMAVARRALAPGAEEFLPPGDDGLWMPAQRTFSSAEPDRVFRPEETTHAEVAIERDFGSSSITVRGFRQHVEDQLATRFGSDISGHADSTAGHYLVGNAGDVDALGCSLAVRTAIAGRVQGTFEYSLAKAQFIPAGDQAYLLLLGSSPAGPQTRNVHSVDTRLEADVPETNTRILVLYRISNGFAHDPGGMAPDGGRGLALDGRFDVQVRQSLPFMNFSNARWEMLIAVRNFFREAGTDQSIYDELLVVRPPKRVVGGVALRF